MGERKGKEMAKRLTAMALVLLCFSLLLVGVGCGKSGRPDPKQTITDFWNAFKSGDYQKAYSYVAASVDLGELKEELESSDPDTEKLLGEVFSKMNMVPKSSKVEGDDATVTTEVTMPDLEKLMEQMSQIIGGLISVETDMASMTEDQTQKLMMEKMALVIKDLPAVTKTTDIKLSWENGDWKIKSNPFEEMEKAFESMGE